METNWLLKRKCLAVGEVAELVFSESFVMQGKVWGRGSVMLLESLSSASPVGGDSLPRESFQSMCQGSEGQNVQRPDCSMLRNEGSGGLSRGSRLDPLGTDGTSDRRHSSQRTEFYPGAFLCLCLGL